jgi:hypothetical protein
MFRFERGLRPLPNEFRVIIIKINLTTNYQLLLNCNKVHRAWLGLQMPHCPNLFVSPF